MNRYLLATLVMLLGGCATLSGSDGAAGQPEHSDWLTYSNLVRTLDLLELERRYGVAVREHAETPSNATAIRLAVLVSDARGAFYDARRAIDLLDGVVVDARDGASDVQFARFLRGILAELVAERAERQALEEQLDALKELEQRLNADELER